MSLVHATSVRNGIVDYVVDQIDVGSANPTGRWLIYTAAFASLLATLNFSVPAFGSATGGVATANPISDDPSASGSGTAAVFKLVNRDVTEVVRGTVSTIAEGTGDLQLSTTDIHATDVISITACTYQAAP